MKRVGIYFFIIVFFNFELSGAIYSYKDEKGNIYITDRPNNGNYKIIVPTRKNPKALLSLKGVETLLTTGEKYRTLAEVLGELYRIPPDLILAIAKAESNFNPYAVSKKGAKGLMQLMPVILKKYNVKDPFSPHENMEAGVRYISYLFKRFKDLKLVIASYNAGPTRVAKSKRVPDIKETKEFLKKVLWYYEYYKKNRQYIDLFKRKKDFKLGFVAFKNREYNLAIKYFEKVFKEYPEIPEVIFNLGLSYDKSGKLFKAKKYYLLAIKNDPFLKEAYYNLAIVYEKLGVIFKAIEVWKKYLDLITDEFKKNEVKLYIKELVMLITQ